MVTKIWLRSHAYVSAKQTDAMQNFPPQQPLLCEKYTVGFLVLIYEQFVIAVIFIYFSTDIDNTSNTNKNNKMHV